MKLRQRIGHLIGRAFRALGINTPGLMDYFVFGGGLQTASGIVVSENNALAISTVHQCVRVIADTIASLPCFVYRRMDSGKERATEHALYRVLHEQPNPFMSPFEFKQTLQGHLCLWGNGYAEIERNGAGQVVNLWPLRPDRMRLQEYGNDIYYYYTTSDGAERQILRSNIFHLRGLSSDGLIGYSPIRLARESLGLHKASEEYRARFFANDARPGGALQTDKTLGDTAYKRLQKFWDENHGGLTNRGRVAILEDGVKWQDVGIPPDDAQFIEGQEYQKSEIAAIFRVPAYKIGHLKPGTVSYASVEQQAIDFVVDCIRPWLVCWEERTTLALLAPAERRTYFAEFLVDALLRGDADSRAKFYQALFNMGAISPNEIRQLENMNSTGPSGDRYYLQLNLVPVDRIDATIKTNTPSDSVDGNLPARPAQMNGAAH